MSKLQEIQSYLLEKQTLNAELFDGLELSSSDGKWGPKTYASIKRWMSQYTDADTSQISDKLIKDNIEKIWDQMRVEASHDEGLKQKLQDNIENGSITNEQKRIVSGMFRGQSSFIDQRTALDLSDDPNAKLTRYQQNDLAKNTIEFLKDQNIDITNIPGLEDGTIDTVGEFKVLRAFVNQADTKELIAGQMQEINDTPENFKVGGEKIRQIQAVLGVASNDYATLVDGDMVADAATSDKEIFSRSHTLQQMRKFLTYTNDPQPGLSADSAAQNDEHLEKIVTEAVGQPLADTFNFDLKEIAIATRILGTTASNLNAIRSFIASAAEEAKMKGQVPVDPESVRPVKPTNAVEPDVKTRGTPDTLRTPPKSLTTDPSELQKALSNASEVATAARISRAVRSGISDPIIDDAKAKSSAQIIMERAKAQLEAERAQLVEDVKRNKLIRDTVAKISSAEDAHAERVKLQGQIDRATAKRTALDDITAAEKAHFDAKMTATRGNATVEATGERAAYIQQQIEAEKIRVAEEIRINSAKRRMLDKVATEQDLFDQRQKLNAEIDRATAKRDATATMTDAEAREVERVKLQGQIDRATAKRDVIATITSAEDAHAEKIKLANDVKLGTAKRNMLAKISSAEDAHAESIKLQGQIDRAAAKRDVISKINSAETAEAERLRIVEEKAKLAEDIKLNKAKRDVVSKITTAEDAHAESIKLQGEIDRAKAKRDVIATITSAEDAHAEKIRLANDVKLGTAKRNMLAKISSAEDAEAQRVKLQGEIDRATAKRNVISTITNAETAEAERLIEVERARAAEDVRLNTAKRNMLSKISSAEEAHAESIKLQGEIDRATAKREALSTIADAEAREVERVKLQAQIDSATAKRNVLSTITNAETAEAERLIEVERARAAEDVRLNTAKRNMLAKISSAEEVHAESVKLQGQIDSATAKRDVISTITNAETAEAERLRVAEELKLNTAKRNMLAKISSAEDAEVQRVKLQSEIERATAKRNFIDDVTVAEKAHAENLSVKGIDVIAETVTPKPTTPISSGGSPELGTAIELNTAETINPSADFDTTTAVKPSGGSPELGTAIDRPPVEERPLYTPQNSMEIPVEANETATVNKPFTTEIDTVGGVDDIKPTRSLSNATATIKAAADSSRAARLAKMGLITTVAATSAAVGLINYAHAEQRNLAGELLKDGYLSQDAHNEYIDLNTRVTAVMTGETIGNQLIVTVPLGIWATEKYAKNEFEVYSIKHNLSQDIHDALGMSFLDEDTLATQFAKGSMDSIPDETQNLDSVLYELWNAKQNYVHAENVHERANPTRTRTNRAEKMEAWRNGETAQKLAEAEQEYSRQFASVFSSQEKTDALFALIPNETKKKLLELTMQYNISEGTHPAIMDLHTMIGEYKNLDEAYGEAVTVEAFNEIIAKDEALSEKIASSWDTILNNPEIINTYLTGIFASNMPASAPENIAITEKRTALEHSIGAMSDLQKTVLINELATGYNSFDRPNHHHMRELVGLYQRKEAWENKSQFQQNKSRNQISTIDTEISNITADLRRSPHVLADILMSRTEDPNATVAEIIAPYQLKQNDLASYFATRIGTDRARTPEQLNVKAALSIGHTTGLLRLDDFLAEQTGINKENLHYGIEIDDFRIQGISYINAAGETKSLNSATINQLNSKLSWLARHHDNMNFDVPSSTHPFRTLQSADEIEQAVFDKLATIDIETLNHSPELQELALAQREVIAETERKKWFNNALTAAIRDRDSLIGKIEGGTPALISKLGINIDQAVEIGTNTGFLTSTFRDWTEETLSIDDITSNPSVFLNDTSSFENAITTLSNHIRNNPDGDMTSRVSALRTLYQGAQNDKSLLGELSAEELAAIEEQSKIDITPKEELNPSTPSEVLISLAARRPAA